MTEIEKALYDLLGAMGPLDPRMPKRAALLAAITRREAEVREETERRVRPEAMALGWSAAVDRVASMADRRYDVPQTFTTAIRALIKEQP